MTLVDIKAFYTQETILRNLGEKKRHMALMQSLSLHPQALHLPLLSSLIAGSKMKPTMKIKMECKPSKTQISMAFSTSLLLGG
jgi:hypothetical protein